MPQPAAATRDAPRDPRAAPPSGRPRRTGWVVALLPAVLAVALVVAGLVTRSDRAAEFDAAVVVVDVPDGDQVTGAVTYDRVPPAGGDHAPQWQRCGVYDAPIPDARAVHSLRRGAVWITYRPGASEDDVATMSAYAGSPRVLVSPRADLPAPVVVTAWGRQLLLDTPGDRGLGAFVRQFQQGTTAPEGALGCASGVTATSG